MADLADGTDEEVVDNRRAALVEAMKTAVPLHLPLFRPFSTSLVPPSKAVCGDGTPTESQLAVVEAVEDAASSARGVTICRRVAWPPVFGGWRLKQRCDSPAIHSGNRTATWWNENRSGAGYRPYGSVPFS